MEPIEQVHPSLAALQRAYGPADDQLQAVAEAYGAIRAGSAPFIVAIIARMLPDLERDVLAEPGHHRLPRPGRVPWVPPSGGRHRPSRATVPPPGRWR